MFKRIRSYLKGVIFECLQQVIKDTPKIVSNRAPNSDDVYGKGTIWEDYEKNERYFAEEVKVKWVKIELRNEEVE